MSECACAYSHVCMTSQMTSQCSKAYHWLVAVAAGNALPPSTFIGEETNQCDFTNIQKVSVLCDTLTYSQLDVGPASTTLTQCWPSDRILHCLLLWCILVQRTVNPTGQVGSRTGCCRSRRDRPVFSKRLAKIAALWLVEMPSRPIRRLRSWGVVWRAPVRSPARNVHHSFPGSIPPTENTRKFSIYIYIYIYIILWKCVFWFMHRLVHSLLKVSIFTMF